MNPTHPTHSTHPTQPAQPMHRQTADLYDAHPDDVHVAEPLFRDYGGLSSFWGIIATVKVYEDNALVRQALEEPGEGKVLVIDGGGSVRSALVGDRLTALALQGGWAGIVVYGCIRDSKAIAAFPIGLKALNTTPARSAKKGMGERNVPVSFAGITWVPGHYLYADEDGMLVSKRELK